MHGFFIEISAILVFAAVLTIIFRLLKQPPILAYILTGILIGPFGQLQFTGTEVLRVMGELGITLLLFMVGLELRVSELKSVGKVAMITGVGQIIFTSIIGYVICLALGFSALSSLYIAIALTFSSTIIIVKLLSDKKDLNSLYGKISVGFLLVQDFVAILALIFLSAFQGAGDEGFVIGDFVFVLFKGAALFALVLYLSRNILPSLIDKIAHSSETLFLFSIAWALGIASLVSSPLIGFSIEIGGFLAGLALANATESYQIVTRIKSLRDFFITIFFITLGMSMTFGNMNTILLPAILLSMFVLIGNPIIVMIVMGVIGYKKRTGFLAGLTVAQISEFSLIVILLGNRIGHVSDDVVSLVTMVGVVTFTFSTYMIMNGNALYKTLSPILGMFEKKNTREKSIESGFDFKDHVILIGANRVGKTILHALVDEGENVLVIDFNPDVIEEAENKNIAYIFGDIADLDIQERAVINKAKLIISTVPDIEDNLLLLESAKTLKIKGKIIVVAYDTREAKDLYKNGADYVILPHLLGGLHLVKMIKEDTLDKLESFRKKDEKIIKTSQSPSEIKN